MFFRRNKNIPAIEGKTAVKLGAKYPNLRALYSKNSAEEKLIIMVAKLLQKSNATINFDDGASYSSKYIGEVLFFLNSVILRIRQNMSVGSQVEPWFAGELLMNSSPQIEIHAADIINYTLEAAKKYPNNIFAKYVPELEKFKQKFDLCEIVARGAQPQSEIEKLNSEAEQQRQKELAELRKNEF